MENDPGTLTPAAVGEIRCLSPQDVTIPARRATLGPHWGLELAMKIRQVIHLIENDGWSLVAVRGSHRQYKHARKAGRVTIAGHPDDDLAPGTLNSVLKQAGLKKPKER